MSLPQLPYRPMSWPKSVHELRGLLEMTRLVIMDTAGVAELKAHLSRYLAKVKQGGEVLITERGRLIARIVPETGYASDEDRAAALRRAGLATGPGHPLGREFLARPRPRDPAGLSLQAVLDDRDSGW